MVIFCAVGGRLSLIGAVYGALLVNLAKTLLSESFPQLWIVFMGALFIGVVLLFPQGLAGIYEDYVRPQVAKLFSRTNQELATWMGFFVCCLIQVILLFTMEHEENPDWSYEKWRDPSLLDDGEARTLELSVEAVLAEVGTKVVNRVPDRFTKGFLVGCYEIHLDLHLHRRGHVRNVEKDGLSIVEQGGCANGHCVDLVLRTF